MNKVCASAPQLADLTPYDPKYLPAKHYMSANENPNNVEKEIRQEIRRALEEMSFNRYPDPLANELRDIIAEANGLDRDWVLVGNGGDELLFSTALAWGGPGRTYLDLPPTFSVYSTNAKLTNTNILSIPRGPAPDFEIDVDRVLEVLADPDNNITYTIIASPNNPTGLMIKQSLLLQILDATDALVLADEAYFEFSRSSIRPYLEQNENLVILRTFSKAFSLAGVRLGYILAHPDVIREYIKVRQPYSVDSVSQEIGKIVFEHRAKFEPAIKQIISERKRMLEELAKIPTVVPYPSDSNWILFSVENAGDCWKYLYDNGVLVRDFSSAALLEGTLRVTIGTPEQNDDFLRLLRDFVGHNISKDN